jgi:hypothetical protein
MIEQLYEGLGFEQIVVNTLSCFISTEKTKFYVLIKSNFENLTRATLINLINTAQQIS